MKSFVFLLAAGAICMFVMPVAADGGVCTCTAVKHSGMGWCGACNSGAAYGVPLKSEKLYEALAGTKVNEKAKGEMACAGCKAALKSDGKCSKCKVSFNKGKEYHSPMACILSKGKRIDEKEIKCGGCSKALKGKKASFCKGCDVGFVSGKAFKGEKLFDEAEQAMGIVMAAVKASDHCETCAVAMVTDGECAKCKTHYKGGKKVKTEL